MLIRKNVRALRDDDWTNFVEALKALKNSGVYDKFVDLHFRNIRKVHGTPFFLPWHRAFLMAFEAEIRQATAQPVFTLPYWDWTEEANVPWQEYFLWSDSWLGGSGDPVTTGTFAGSAQWPTVPYRPLGFGQDLIRNLAFGNDSPATSRAVVLEVLTGQQVYDPFRRALENGPHGYMHTWVGGQMGRVQTSPNDPVFWLHHANVDRIWAQWQEMYPGMPTESDSTDPVVMGPSSPMPPSAPNEKTTKLVEDVVDAPFTSYAYDAYYQADLNWSADTQIPVRGGVSGTPGLVSFAGTLFYTMEGADGSGWVSAMQAQGANKPGPAVLIPDSQDAYGTSGQPALILFGETIYCIHEGRNNSGWVWCGTYNGTSWSLDALIPDNQNAFGTTGPPALGVYAGKLFCVRQGSNNSGWTWCASNDGTNWSTDELIPDDDDAYGVSGSPALAVFGGKLYCAREGRSNSGWVWCGTYDGGRWSADALIRSKDDDPCGTSGTPSLVSFAGQLFCIREGRENDGRLHWAAFDGHTWGIDRTIWSNGKTLPTDTPPALAVHNGMLYCVRRDPDNTSQLLVATASMVIPAG